MQELLGSHAFLTNLETELGKERDSLVQQCTRKSIVPASYPILEHYYNLTNQYFDEQNKFRTLLEAVHHQQQHQQQKQQQLQGISLMMSNATSSTSDVSRKIAPTTNGSSSYSHHRHSDTMPQLCEHDDNKQREQETQTVPPPLSSSNLHHDENETKVEPRSSHVHVSTASHSEPPQRRKPPVKSSSVTATISSLNSVNMGRHLHLHDGVIVGHQNGGAAVSTPPHKPPKKPPAPSSSSLHVLPSQQAPPLPLPPAHVHVPSQPPPQATRDRVPSQKLHQQQQQQQQQQHQQQQLAVLKARRKITVQRHKYHYEGRGFEIWRRNLQRPIYTASSLRLARHFNGDERLARRFLVEKAGFRPEHVEQVSFILKKENGQPPRIERHKEIPVKKIDFTVVRVRAALAFIYDCIDRVERDPDCGADVIKLQMNRPPKTKKSVSPSAKLRVSNFDILDKNTHYQITRLFLQFGDLEHDIMISADRKKDPFAIVQFRSVSDAAFCLKTHTDKKATTLFFPPRDASGKDGDRDAAAATDNDAASAKQRFLNRKLHIEFVFDAADKQGNKAAGNRARRGGRGIGRGGRR